MRCFVPSPRILLRDLNACPTAIYNTRDIKLVFGGFQTNLIIRPIFTHEMKMLGGGGGVGGTQKVVRKPLGDLVLNQVKFALIGSTAVQTERF